MIRKLSFLAVTVVTFCSCGPGKKLTSANAQITQLQANAQSLKKNLETANHQVADLTDKNNSITDQLSGCQQNARAVEQKFHTTQALIQEERQKMEKVQEKLSTALADFESKGVSIYTKDGNLYVSMEDKLLYKSGSAALCADGKKALIDLAGVLNGYPTLEVTVLGNTDDVLFKKGSDNWTLSTERANGVVRVLRDASVNPDRLTAAGRGRYNPVADNSTAEGRAKNRRTDIILNPDVQRVWESMDK